MKNGTEDGERSGWFHCGRCGAFFGAEVGTSAPETCPECGNDPLGESSKAGFPQVDDGSERSDEGRGRSDLGEGGARWRGESRRKRELSGVVAFVGIWLLVLLILAGAVKYFQKSGDGEDDRLGFEMFAEDERLLFDQIQACQTKVVGMLDAGVPEKRIEFVMNPAKTLPRMAGRQQDFAYSSDGSDLEQVIAGVIDTPKGKAIETVWGIDGGQRIEAVFFPDEKDEWKIDWFNMVRYSEQDWPLFLLGDGEDEGEFRLLARRRSADSKKAGTVESVVLISPRAGRPGELGASSPEVAVDPDSRIGRVLAAAFEKCDAGEGIYGSESAQLDPNGMIRLRAKVVREGLAGGGRAFVIREILACHWYDFDDLGLGD